MDDVVGVCLSGTGFVKCRFVCKIFVTRVNLVLFCQNGGNFVDVLLQFVLFAM